MPPNDRPTQLPRPPLANLESEGNSHDEGDQPPCPVLEHQESDGGSGSESDEGSADDGNDSDSSDGWPEKIMQILTTRELAGETTTEAELIVAFMEQETEVVDEIEDGQQLALFQQSMRAVVANLIDQGRMEVDALSGARRRSIHRGLRLKK